MVGTAAPSGPDGRVDAAAAEWFARMRADHRTPAEEARFQSWLEALPEHAKAYAALTRSIETVSAFAETPEIRDMRAAALRRPHPALRLITSAPRRAVAASFAAACLILTLFLTMPGMPWSGSPEQGIHETDAGVLGNVALKDGTLVTLAANSRIEERFTPGERRVRLVRGQAIFDVMHNPERPFVVDVGNGEVVALGTVFDVRKQNRKFVVTLVRGKVKVTARPPHSEKPVSVRLTAGEQVSGSEDRLSGVREVDLARATSWQNGLLWEKNTPVIDFVDEFNRYSRYKLLIDRFDPRLRRLRISGAFRVDEPMRVVEYLKGKLELSYERTGSGHIRLRIYGRRSEDR